MPVFWGTAGLQFQLFTNLLCSTLYSPRALSYTNHQHIKYITWPMQPNSYSHLNAQAYHTWKEHIRVSSTLIMPPALSNSPQ